VSDRSLHVVCDSTMWWMDFLFDAVYLHP